MQSCVFRWYLTSLAIEIDALYDLLLRKRYSGSGCGFEINEYSKKRISLKFIERIEIKEVVLDPSGDESVYSLVRFVVFEVDFFHDKGIKIVMKVKNPPRSMASFLDALRETTQFRVHISPIIVNVEDVYRSVIKNTGVTQVVVKKAILRDIPFNRHTSAKIELTSSANAFDEFKEKYKSDNYTLSRMFISARISGKDEFLDVSRSGIVKGSDGILHLAEKYLLEIGG
jgi:hypothetical protein